MQTVPTFDAIPSNRRLLRASDSPDFRTSGQLTRRSDAPSVTITVIRAFSAHIEPNPPHARYESEKHDFPPHRRGRPGVQDRGWEESTCQRVMQRSVCAAFCSARIGICAQSTARRRRRRKRGRLKPDVRFPWVALDLCGIRRAKARQSTKSGKPWSGCTSMDESHGSSAGFSDGRPVKHRRLNPDAVSAAHQFRSCKH